jgi:hypothetical protein
LCPRQKKNLKKMLILTPKFVLLTKTTQKVILFLKRLRKHVEMKMYTQIFSLEFFWHFIICLIFQIKEAYEPESQNIVSMWFLKQFLLLMSKIRVPITTLLVLIHKYTKH